MAFTGSDICKIILVRIVLCCLLLVAVFGRASVRACVTCLAEWVQQQGATLQDKRTSRAEQNRIEVIIMLTAVSRLCL